MTCFFPGFTTTVGPAATASLLLTLTNPARSQQLSLDLQIGGQYAYAEGGHFGIGKRPFKGHEFLITPFVAPMLRLQLKDETNISIGYSGGGLGWGYKLQVPKAQSNGAYGGAYGGHAVSVYLDRLPLLVSWPVARFDFQPLPTEAEQYAYSIRFCQTCNLGAGIVSPQDTIVFRQQPSITRHWGAFLTGGATARFYRLGRERFNISLFLNQGLTTMMRVPVQYTYNSQRGAVTLPVPDKAPAAFHLTAVEG
ncbi:hypothetical protein [Hymenobacter swuensis]|uniref:Uncharacterized protein n=1 Tax=Hymenobacter swuensis DY53 TaxID=1227739 RepID=W8F183_9BACT|nr:hypothetical protein [Hymenobacter swuensis]AHJ97782.1 hypothetical protein Hsw_2187 [Hymenobacter swuensis DY53]